MRKASHPILRWAYWLFVALMPFYWCAPAVPMETPNCPMSFLEGLLSTTLPLPLFGVCVGLLLLATAIQCGNSFDRKKLGASALVPLLAALPMAAGLAGLVHTTEWSYAGNWFLHWASIAALAAGVCLASHDDEKLLPGLFNAIAVTGALAAFHGWTQHFGGLQSNYEMQVRNAAESGVPLTEQMLLKLQQTRSYGSFCDPNVYAAHLLLTGPFLLLALHRIAGRCEEKQRTAATALLVGGGAVLLLGALYFSGSRGAFIGAAAGLALFGWQRWLRRFSWKALLATGLAGLLLLAAAVAFLSLRTNRRLETASVRAEYYACAWRLFLEKPVFGVGLGEFFNGHARLKPWHADDSRDAHSFLFAQLSQCGLAGAVDALVRLLVPLALAFGALKRHRRRDELQNAAVLSAWSAWIIHNLLQFNDLITSTTAMAALCGLFVLEEGRAAADASAKPLLRSPARLAFTAAAAVFALFSAMQLPKWHRLQALENLLHDRYTRPEVAVSACQLEARRSRFNLIAVRLLCDYTAMRPEFQQEGNAAALAYAHRVPRRAGAHTRVAAFAIRQGNLAQAGEALTRARACYPCSPQVLLMEGILALEDLTAAERQLMSQWSAERVQGNFETRDVAVQTYARQEEYAAKATARRLVERLNTLRLPAPDDSAKSVHFRLVGDE